LPVAHAQRTGDDSRVRLGKALPLVLLAAGCEEEALHMIPEEPDSGVAVDAAPRDGGFVDAGFVDAGFPDAAEPPPAPEPIYVHTGETLYSYDPARNVASPIANFHSSSGPITDMVDIAIDLDGRMYGGTVAKEVFTIDPETGLCRKRFDFADRLHGLTFLSDGTLVVAGERVSLVDATSGRVIREIVGLEGLQTSGDIVGLPDGKLYWTVRGSNESGDRVTRIDPQTGAVRELGETGVERLYGLAYAEGVLYGFSSDGLVVNISPTSGDVMSQRTLDARWWGATTNPVLWR
jgi:outer membrane protein assembly factor BamB